MIWLEKRSCRWQVKNTTKQWQVGAEIKFLSRVEINNGGGARQDLGNISSVGENGRRKISHQQIDEWIESDRGRHIYIGRRINMNGETKISKSATPDPAVQYLPSILDPFWSRFCSF